MRTKAEALALIVALLRQANDPAVGGAESSAFRGRAGLIQAKYKITDAEVREACRRDPASSGRRDGEQTSGRREQTHQRKRSGPGSGSQKSHSGSGQRRQRSEEPRGPNARARAQYSSSRRARARYAGTCGHCGRKYAAGESIAYVRTIRGERGRHTGCI